MTDNPLHRGATTFETPSKQLIFPEEATAAAGKYINTWLPLRRMSVHLILGWLESATVCSHRQSPPFILIEGTPSMTFLCPNKAYGQRLSLLDNPLKEFISMPRPSVLLSFSI